MQPELTESGRLTLTADGRLDLDALLALSREEQTEALAPLNRELDAMSAPERVRWALANLPGEHVLSSSFGIQAALMLHLVSRERADVPVVLTDTGYLFPETYHFIDELTERLSPQPQDLPGRAQRRPGRRPASASCGSREWRGSPATTSSTRWSPWTAP